MIQDDFGNLVHTPGTASVAQQFDAIAEQFDAGNARMTRIEQDLADNTKATRATADSTSELVDLLQAFKGAFKVIDWVGKLARPVGFIVSAGLAIWASLKTGAPTK